jgi:hypothetical protein
MLEEELWDEELEAMIVRVDEEVNTEVVFEGLVGESVTEVEEEFVQEVVDKSVVEFEDLVGESVVEDEEEFAQEVEDRVEVEFKGLVEIEDEFVQEIVDRGVVEKYEVMIEVVNIVLMLWELELNKPELEELANSKLDELELDFKEEVDVIVGVLDEVEFVNLALLLEELDIEAEVEFKSLVLLVRELELEIWELEESVKFKPSGPGLKFDTEVEVTDRMVGEDEFTNLMLLLE